MGNKHILGQIAKNGVFWSQAPTILEKFQFSHFNGFLGLFQIQNILNDPSIIFVDVFGEITRFGAKSPKWVFWSQNPTILELFQFSHFNGFVELFQIQKGLNDPGIIFP